MGRMIVKEKKLVVPKKFDKLKAWSFSLHRRYQGCARMVALEKLQKRAFSNSGMDRGVDIHASAEDYLGGVVKKIPASLKLVADHAKLLKADKTTQVELELAFTKQWKPTGWFDGDCYFRMKVDARRETARKGNILIASEVTDWKSGKPNSEWDDQQAELYAVGEFAAYNPQTVKTVFAHTDTGDESEALFMRNEAIPLQKAWDAKTKRMMNDERFDPTPKGWICGWCPQNAKNPAFPMGACDVGIAPKPKDGKKAATPPPKKTIRSVLVASPAETKKFATKKPARK